MPYTGFATGNARDDGQVNSAGQCEYTGGFGGIPGLVGSLMSADKLLLLIPGQCIPGQTGFIGKSAWLKGRFMPSLLSVLSEWACQNLYSGRPCVR